MRWASLSAAFVLALGVLAEDASDVLNLVASDFEAKVKDEPLILVEFFAPWCGHCKALAPHYEEAATVLKERNIKLAKVDCVDQADFCQQKGIQGYPTLKVYKNGTPADYTGPRKAEGIISYMVKQSLPAVSPVTADNHEEIKKADKVVAIAYLKSSTDAPGPEFSATAEKHRDDYLFGLTTDPDAIAVAGVTPPAIVVYRSFDEPKTEYPYPVLDAKLSDMEEWLAEMAVPILDEVNGENYGLYANSPKPLAYLFIDVNDEKSDEHIAMVKPIAAKYKSKINFVWIDAVKFVDHGKALNLNEPKWPAFVIQNVEKQLKYPIPQSKDLTAELVTEQIVKYLDGALVPDLKSQPIPETQDESTFNLVGKQFDEIVFDDKKDVFVEFYATWCGHCKRLKPIWDQLGEHYKPISDRLLIAKMEATENDLPPSVPFRISGFPTIKFKPAGTKEFIEYEGDRSYESLKAFVEEHAKNSLEMPIVAQPDEGAQKPLVKEKEAANSSGHDEL